MIKKKFGIKNCSENGSGHILFFQHFCYAFSNDAQFVKYSQIKTHMTRHIRKGENMAFYRPRSTKMKCSKILLGGIDPACCTINFKKFMHLMLLKMLGVPTNLKLHVCASFTEC